MLKAIALLCKYYPSCKLCRQLTVLKVLIIGKCLIVLGWRHDTEQNDTQHNIKKRDTQHNDTLYVAVPKVVFLICYSECRYTLY